MKELEAWVWTKVEAWEHGVRNLSKIAKQYPQLVYAGLEMLLYLKCQYLQRTVPGVGTMMGIIEDAIR